MKQYRCVVRAVLGTLLAVPFAVCQTQITLPSQSRNVDFSAAVSTKPAKVGTTLPTTCSVGEVFFKTNAPAGQNLFGCTATNIWSDLDTGTGGGAGTAAQLLDFSASNTSNTVQTIGANCSTTTPCMIRVGAVVFSLTSPVSATISGTSASGTVYWYLSASQVLTAGHSSAATLSCSAGCSVATGVTGFPSDALPLWQTTFTNLVWNPINETSMDKRAFLSRNVLASGPGISSVSDPTTGVQTLSTDPTQVPRYFTGSGAPATTCTAGRDFYTDTTNANLYFCKTTNLWQLVTGSGGGGSTAPFSDWKAQTSAIAMTGSDVTLYSTTLPAGTLAAGKCLELQFGNILSSGSTAVTLKLAFGASSFTLISAFEASSWNWHFLWCNNPGATNAQQLTAFPLQFGTSFTLPSIPEVSTTAIDTTAAVTVKLMANGPSSDTETGLFWQMKVIP